MMHPYKYTSLIELTEELIEKCTIKNGIVLTHRRFTIFMTPKDRKKMKKDVEKERNGYAAATDADHLRTGDLYSGPNGILITVIDA